jgi:hypothetical protein
MIFENVSTMGALVFLFLMIYLATDPKDVSLLTIPAYFGGMWVTNWLTENGFQGTFMYNELDNAVYVILMFYLIFASIRLGIRNIKYIKEKIRKRRAIKKKKNNVKRDRPHGRCYCYTEVQCRLFNI